MGWWGTGDTLVGDEVCDIMGDAVDAIEMVYTKKVGRKPSYEELKATFDFVVQPRYGPDLT